MWCAMDAVCERETERAREREREKESERERLICLTSPDPQKAATRGEGKTRLGRPMGFTSWSKRRIEKKIEKDTEKLSSK